MPSLGEGCWRRAGRYRAGSLSHGLLRLERGKGREALPIAIEGIVCGAPRRQLMRKPLGGQAINVASGTVNCQLRSMAHAAAVGRFGRAVHAWGAGAHAAAGGRFGRGRMLRGLTRMPRRSAIGRTPQLPGGQARMLGVLARMPRPLVGARLPPLPGVLARMLGVLARMPRQSVDSDAGAHAWGAGTHASAGGAFGRTADATGGMPMPRRGVWGRLVTACPAQPGVPADRCAREIVGVLAHFLGRARGS